MVQFCPKCGTKEPDEEAVFCNRCGNRLPPHIPEKKGIICPACGAKIRDMQAVFCDKCGSPLHTVSPVQVLHAGVRPAAARPVMKKERCPSCGAPRVDEISDYCNVCGAYIRGPGPLPITRETSQQYPEKPGPAPLPITRETSQQYPEKPGPGNLVADSYGDGKDYPVQKKSRRPLLKWGLVSVVAVIILVVIGTSISGVIPGFNQTSNATPAPELSDQGSETALMAEEPIPAEELMPEPLPEEEPATPIPTTVATTIVTTKVTTKATTKATAKVSATATANASATVTAAMAITDPSLPLPIGQSAYDGKGKLTVNSISFKDKMSDPTPSYAIGKKYLIISITYENLQDETVDADLSRMMVKDGGGFPFDPASDTLLETVYTGKTILPGEKRTGNLLFIVPPTATFLKLEYSTGNQLRAIFQLT